MTSIPDLHFPTVSLPPGHISGVWNHLQNQYEEMLKEASPQEDVAVTVFLFGGTEIQVQSLGYAGPNLLMVFGKLNDGDITAFVHQSCLQIVYSKVAKDEKGARIPIGFVHETPQTSRDKGEVLPTQ